MIIQDVRAEALRIRDTLGLKHMHRIYNPMHTIMIFTETDPRAIFQEDGFGEQCRKWKDT